MYSWRQVLLRGWPWAAGVAIVLVAAGAWHLWASRGSRDAAGIYLVAGGQSLVVIEPGLPGLLKVKDGYIHAISNAMIARIPNVSIETNYTNGRLQLDQTERFELDSSHSHGGPNSHIVVLSTTAILEPSRTVPGDWDLVEAQLISRVRPSVSELFNLGSWKDAVNSASSIGEFFKNAISPIKAHPLAQADLDPAKSPLRSFLHRVDDPRIVNYFHDRWEGRTGGANPERIRAIAADHAGDPYLALHRVDLEANEGDAAEAERLWEEWEATHAESPDLLLQRMARRVFKNVLMAHLRVKNPDLSPIIEEFPAPYQTSSSPVSKQMTLEQRLNWFRELLEADGLLYTTRPLVPAVFQPKGGYPTVPGFLEIQTAVKVARVVATLRLFEGRREESLELLAGCYRFGQSLNADGFLIARLIGIAVRAIAIGGLEVYVLNACETPEEARRCWAMLERLHNTPGQETGEYLFEGEYSSLQCLMVMTGPMVPNYLEAQSRHRTADAKFQILRAAAAARFRAIETGTLPSVETEFAPWLPDGLPADPFDKDKPLRLTRLDADLAVYSIGPDKDDDAARVAYDPTNGTTSNGDLLTRIPRDRRYPFPADGVRAADAADLLRQFPKGLPVDPFADTRGRPLSILDATTTHPLFIFSFGPDTDERDKILPFGRRTRRANPPVPGETRDQRVRRLQLVFSEDGKTTTPLAPALEQESESSEGEAGFRGPRRRSRRGMMGRGGRGRRGVPPLGGMPGGTMGLGGRPEPWTDVLDPPYDPTNGTTSDGDLIIPIPQ